MSDTLTVGQRLQRWLPLALIGAIVLAYRNSFSGVFIFDDTVIIQTNPKVQHLWPLWDAVLRPTRWLTDLTYAVNFAIGGMNPADFHAGNLLIHLGAALFLFGLTRRILDLPRWAGRWAGRSVWMAFAVALVWAVHPLQTESVTYIVQRDESLMGFFYLMTLYVYARGTQSAHPRRWIDLSLVSCLLGMGAKEVIVSIPIAIPLFDRLFIYSDWREAFARRWKTYLAFALLWGVFFIQLLHINPDDVGLETARGYHGFSRWEYLLTQFEVIPHYLRLVFYPVGQCLDYMWLPAESVRVWVWPGIVLWGIIGAAVWGLFRSHPIGWTAALFLLILAPTSSFMPLPDPAFEHRMYLPLAAVLGTLVVLIFEAVAVRWRGSDFAKRTLYGVGVVGISTLLIAATYVRNRDYQSESRMWMDVVAKRPQNWRAYLGVSKSLLEKAEFEKSIEWGRLVMERMPDYAALTEDGIAALTRAPTAERIKAAYYVMLLNNLGVAHSQLGRVDEALPYYRTVLRFRPDDAAALNNLGYELYLRGETNTAVGHWMTTLRADPKNAAAHGFLGMVSEERQEWARAVRHYEAVLRAAPNHVVYLYRLGWILAAVPVDEVRDPARALHLARAVLRETEGQSAKAWDLLGVVYSNLSDFDSAIDAAQRAKARIDPAADAEATASGALRPTRQVLTAAEVDARLAAYRAGRPWRLETE